MIESRIALQLQTQSESQHVIQLEMSQNIAKLNDSVVDLTTTVSKSSTIKTELDELRNSIIQPHSMIGFKPSLTTFQAVPAASSLLDGIISYLTTRHCGNLHDRGILKVFANRVYSGDATYAAKNVVDLKTDSYFHSVNDLNQSIGYDFKEMMRIIPTHYSVRSYHDGPNDHHLRSWVVEVSKDCEGWEVVDERTDCQDLNDKFAVQCFAIQRPPQTENRYIRLRQTGVNWVNQHYVIICGFEVFGQLRMSDREQM
jgi:hypothetical protein